MDQYFQFNSGGEDLYFERELFQQVSMLTMYPIFVIRTLIEGILEYAVGIQIVVLKCTILQWFIANIIFPYKIKNYVSQNICKYRNVEQCSCISFEREISPNSCKVVSLDHELHSQWSDTAPCASCSIHVPVLRSYSPWSRRRTWQPLGQIEHRWCGWIGVRHNCLERG